MAMGTFDTSEFPVPTWFNLAPWHAFGQAIFDLPCLSLTFFKSACEAATRGDLYVCREMYGTTAAFLRALGYTPPTPAAWDILCFPFVGYLDQKICSKLARFERRHPECSGLDAPIVSRNRERLWIPAAHRMSHLTTPPVSNRLFTRRVPTPKGPIIHGGCAACDGDPELELEEEL